MQDNGLTTLYICILALDPRFDNIVGASHPGGDLDGIRRAIDRAGTTFHAAVAVTDLGVLIDQFEHPVRTYDFTCAAAYTGLTVKLQSRYPGKISEVFHLVNPINVCPN